MPRPRELHDEFFKRAKAEGYAARSAYKLLELNNKKRLMRTGDKVLDLGCAPGSWLQVASRIVGPSGLVFGIDLQDVTIDPLPNVRTAVRDIFSTPPEFFLEASRGTLFDCVLSDMAPNTSGHGDDYLSVRLCRRVLELLPSVLAPGGNLCMKVLEGAEFPELLRETKRVFVTAGATKPRASRDVSREIFIAGHSYAPRPETRQLRPVDAAPPAPAPPPGWNVR
jgi:23S rRNA (uridine2552-2'-O)-methyltransferase